MTRKSSQFILKLYGVFTGFLILFFAYYIANHSSPLPKPNEAKQKKYPQIGYITYVEGDVRTRTAGELLWLPSKKTDIIHDSDSVFTGNNGKIQIHLIKDTTLQVSKDSLIRISRRNQLNTIHLEEGEMQISSAADEKALLQVNNRSRLLKLTGVEEKLTYQKERQYHRQNKIALSEAPPQEFAEALTENPEPDQTKNDIADDPTEPAPEAASTEIKKPSHLDDDTTKSFIVWLAIGYGVFSLLAMKELFAIRKN